MTTNASPITTEMLDTLLQCAAGLGDVDPDRTEAIDTEVVEAVVCELGETGVAFTDAQIEWLFDKADPMLVATLTARYHGVQ